MRIRYSSNVTLQADTYYPLLIYFGERTGGDRIDFGWQGPGQGWTTNMSGVAFIITMNFHRVHLQELQEVQA